MENIRHVCLWHQFTASDGCRSSTRIDGRINALKNGAAVYVALFCMNNLHLCRDAKMCAPHLDIKDVLNQGQTREFKGPFLLLFCYDNLTREQSLLFNDAT